MRSRREFFRVTLFGLGAGALAACSGGEEAQGDQVSVISWLGTGRWKISGGDAAQIVRHTVSGLARDCEKGLISPNESNHDPDFTLEVLELVLNMNDFKQWEKAFRAKGYAIEAVTAFASYRRDGSERYGFRVFFRGLDDYVLHEIVAGVGNSGTTILRGIPERRMTASLDREIRMDSSQYPKLFESIKEAWVGRNSGPEQALQAARNAKRDLISQTIQPCRRLDGTPQPPGLPVEQVVTVENKEGLSLVPLAAGTAVVMLVWLLGGGRRQVRQEARA